MLKRGLLVATAAAASIGASSSAWAAFEAVDDFFSVIPGSKVSFTVNGILGNDVCTLGPPANCRAPLVFKGVVTNSGFKKTGIIDVPGGKYGTGGRLKFKPNGQIVFFAGENFDGHRFGYGVRDQRPRHSFALGLINVSPS